MKSKPKKINWVAEAFLKQKPKREILTAEQIEEAERDDSSALYILAED